MIRLLDTSEQQVVLSALKAIESGRYIDAFEMETRIGVSREQLRQVIAEWPMIDDESDDSDGVLAINNCLNEVCHGVPIPDHEWHWWFQSDKAEVKRVYRKWASARDWNHTGIK